MESVFYKQVMDGELKGYSLKKYKPFPKFLARERKNIYHHIYEIKNLACGEEREETTTAPF